MIIDGRQIGPGHPPYLVAEMSGEHRGNFGLACDLIKAAKAAGADAVKAQLYDPDRLAEARGGRDKVLTDGLWKGRTLGDLYREAHTPREWFPDLFDFARDAGITLFSSVFHKEDVEYLYGLGCPAFKISSFEITELDLIREAAATGRPLIISTGMASTEDMIAALNETVIEEPGQWCCKELCEVALLHCVSAYPCPVSSAHLARLRYFIGEFGVETRAFGFSDHTLGTTAAIVATALGASIIEKHITLSRADGGPDAAFSLEPAEFKKLVQDVKDAYASLGTGERPKSEDIYRDLRRKG